MAAAPVRGIAKMLMLSVPQNLSKGGIPWQAGAAVFQPGKPGAGFDFGWRESEP
jgi:hypothetical protein